MSTVRTFKFLAAGARGALSGFQWPVPSGAAPGDWVETRGTLDPCLRDAHVCRVSTCHFGCTTSSGRPRPVPINVYVSCAREVRSVERHGLAAKRDLDRATTADAGTGSRAHSDQRRRGGIVVEPSFGACARF